MKCPHCQAEIPTGKFCPYCGSPLEFTAPPTQRPKRLWLWLTIGLLGLVVVAFLGLAFLGSKRSNNNVSGGGEAAGVVKTYLEARKSGDAAGAYATLSPAAQAAYRQTDFTAYYKTKVLSYGQIEAASAAASYDRVVVQNVAFDDGVTYPSMTWTVTQIDGKSYLALDTPLNVQIDKAYNDKNYDEVLKLAAQMLAINPYSYDYNYNRGWAYIETGKYPDALAAFSAADQNVNPVDRAELTRSVGVAYQREKQWALAGQKYEEALQQAAPYPKRWDKAWTLQASLDLATIYQEKGDTAKAHDLVERLDKQYPGDAGVGKAAIAYERTPYSVANGMATYRLFLRGISFALPKDWIVSSDTTGGDYWFARHPASAKGRVDLGVYFHDSSYAGKNLDEFADFVLKEKREPIGAPKNNTTIVAKKSVTIGGRPGLQLTFSTGVVSVLVQSSGQWVEFEWFKNDAAQPTLNQWLPTVQIN